MTTEGAVIRTGPGSGRSNVYQRNTYGTASTADDTTTKLNVSEKVVPESPKGAIYNTASADGHRVFFTTSEALTDDSPVGLGHIYMWHDDYLNDEVQKLTVQATGGQFKLSLGGEETADLPYNATDAEIEAALKALPSVEAANGDIEVSGGPGDETGTSPYTIAFKGGLAETDEPTMTTVAGTTPLEGGAATATVAPGSRAAAT